MAIYYLSGSWKIATNFPSGVDVYCIANLYGTYNAGTSDGIYYQSGGEWYKATNFHEDRVNCFTDVDGVIYAGTSESLYYQGTGSWEKA
ncbi:hypothetical protein, partial [Shewanella surugensis]